MTRSPAINQTVAINNAVVTLARELRYAGQVLCALRSSKGMDAKHAGFIVSLVVTALLLACSQNMDPLKVKGDVTKAQADGDKMIMDAQANLDLVNAQNNSDVVDALVRARALDPRNASTAATNNADAHRLRTEAKKKMADAIYGVDKAKAQASYNEAKAQCEAHAGAASNSCRNDATANFDSEMASAKARRQGVDRQVRTTDKSASRQQRKFAASFA
jgi:hypothetical protein